MSGGKCPGGICPWGKCPGGTHLGGYVLEPYFYIDMRNRKILFSYNLSIISHTITRYKIDSHYSTFSY